MPLHFCQGIFTFVCRAGTAAVRAAKLLACRGTAPLRVSARGDNGAE
jgi:hypothetical protein